MPASHFMKKFNVSKEKAEKMNRAYKASKDVIDLDEVLNPRKDLLRSKRFGKKLWKAEKAALRKATGRKTGSYLSGTPVKNPKALKRFERLIFLSRAKIHPSMLKFEKRGFGNRKAAKTGKQLYRGGGKKRWEWTKAKTISHY